MELVSLWLRHESRGHGTLGRQVVKLGERCFTQGVESFLQLNYDACEIIASHIMIKKKK